MSGKKKKKRQERQEHCSGECLMWCDHMGSRLDRDLRGEERLGLEETEEQMYWE